MPSILYQRDSAAKLNLARYYLYGAKLHVARSYLDGAKLHLARSYLDGVKVHVARSYLDALYPLRHHVCVMHGDQRHLDPGHVPQFGGPDTCREHEAHRQIDILKTAYTCLTVIGWPVSKKQLQERRENSEEYKPYGHIFIFISDPGGSISPKTTRTNRKNTIIQSFPQYPMSSIQTCWPMVPKSGRESDRTAYRVNNDSN